MVQALCKEAAGPQGKKKPGFPGNNRVWLFLLKYLSRNHRQLSSD